VKDRNVIPVGLAEVRSNLIDDILTRCVRVQKLYNMQSTAIKGIRQVIMHVLHVIEAAVESANISRILIDANEQSVNLIRH
jgi:hypothetical protein